MILQLGAMQLKALKLCGTVKMTPRLAVNYGNSCKPVCLNTGRFAKTHTSHAYELRVGNGLRKWINSVFNSIKELFIQFIFTPRLHKELC